MNSRQARAQAAARQIGEAARELSALWSSAQGDTHKDAERAATKLAWLASSESPRTNYRVRAKVLNDACALVERIADGGEEEAREALTAIEAALADTETGEKHAIDCWGAIAVRVYALRHSARCDARDAVGTWVRILRLLATASSEGPAWKYALRCRPTMRFEEREANWALEAARELVTEARTNGGGLGLAARLSPIGWRIRSRLVGVPRDCRVKLANRFEDTLKEMYGAAS